MRRLMIILIATLFPFAATATDDGGYALAITKFWFKGEKKLGCVKSNGDRTLCQINADTNFEVYYSPDRKHTLVIVDYLPDATGNASLRAAVTTEEASETGGWGVSHEIYDVTGQEPTDIKFTQKHVSFVMKTKKHGDPRCCPTGHKLYKIPL